MMIRALFLASGLCLASMVVLPSPVRADEISDLDQLSRATDDAKAGLALAREQIGSGDLSGAMATVERLMINHPDTNEAELLHASLLCRLDDRVGASSEFASLRKRNLLDQAWQDANAPCAVAPAGATNTNGDAIPNSNRQRR